MVFVTSKKKFKCKYWSYPRKSPIGHKIIKSDTGPKAKTIFKFPSHRVSQKSSLPHLTFEETEINNWASGYVYMKKEVIFDASKNFLLSRKIWFWRVTKKSKMPTPMKLYLILFSSRLFPSISRYRQQIKNREN